MRSKRHAGKVWKDCLMHDHFYSDGFALPEKWKIGLLVTWVRISSLQVHVWQSYGPDTKLTPLYIGLHAVDILREWKLLQSFLLTEMLRCCKWDQYNRICYWLNTHNTKWVIHSRLPWILKQCSRCSNKSSNELFRCVVCWLQSWWWFKNPSAIPNWL